MRQGCCSMRSMLDEAEFNSLWTEGRAMTMEQAIEFALADTDKGGSS
jgi:hypothetical protein